MHRDLHRGELEALRDKCLFIVHIPRPGSNGVRHTARKLGTTVLDVLLHPERDERCRNKVQVEKVQVETCSNTVAGNTVGGNTVGGNTVCGRCTGSTDAAIHGVLLQCMRDCCMWHT